MKYTEGKITLDVGEHGIYILSDVKDVETKFMAACSLMASCFSEKILDSDDWVEPTTTMIKELVRQQAEDKDDENES